MCVWMRTYTLGCRCARELAEITSGSEVGVFWISHLHSLGIHSLFHLHPSRDILMELLWYPGSSIIGRKDLLVYLSITVLISNLLFWMFTLFTPAPCVPFILHTCSLFPPLHSGAFLSKISHCEPNSQRFLSSSLSLTLLSVAFTVTCFIFNPSSSWCLRHHSSTYS